MLGFVQLVEPVIIHELFTEFASITKNLLCIIPAAGVGVLYTIGILGSKLFSIEFTTSSSAMYLTATPLLWASLIAVAISASEAL